MRLYSFLIILACWLGLGASLNEAQGNVDRAYNNSFRATVSYPSLCEKQNKGDGRLRKITKDAKQENSEIHSNHTSRHTQSRERDRSFDLTSCADFFFPQPFVVVASTKLLSASTAHFTDSIQLLLYPKHSFW